MELLNRGRQRDLLLQLAEAYPMGISGSQLGANGDDHSVRVNIWYLHEHELVEASRHDTLDGDMLLGGVTITARGMDFLMDDGGLGAILGVVTVKLHADTVRSLLIDKVKASDGDSTVKGKLIDQLKSLPSEAVSKLAEKALEKGLEHMPGAVQWLQTALSS